ncbi:MAG: hypothetical protein COA78_36805 [Blastopirellula sp.]|nr:MAG: hypothetical protein COA78_36805 [Blastopirellula sp.]
MNVPIAESAGNGFNWGGLLSGALDVYAKVETIKGRKSASGGDQMQAKLRPEMENAATRVIAPQIAPAAAAPSTNIMIGGVSMNKNILIGTAGVLLAIFVIKKI